MVSSPRSWGSFSLIQPDNPNAISQYLQDQAEHGHLTSKMSLIGKIQGALTSLSKENILALANMNFNFSVFKMEAPPEFTGLGDALSARRREEAEDGLYHRIARRLGALFVDVIPSIPELIRAYWKRVSEISTSQTEYGTRLT